MGEKLAYKEGRAVSTLPHVCSPPTVRAICSRLTGGGPAGPSVSQGEVAERPGHAQAELWGQGGRRAPAALRTWALQSRKSPPEAQ